MRQSYELQSRATVQPLVGQPGGKQAHLCGGERKTDAEAADRRAGEQQPV